MRESEAAPVISRSRKVVYAATAANLGIAATKFIAAALSGSSAMLSEAIHSVIDTGNQLLLLFGLHRSQLPPDELHPFGHGKELYFWSLIVAVLLFGVGGGMALYEGIEHALTPRALENPFWAYVVLAVAAVFESCSLIVAVRELLRRRGPRAFWLRVHRSKDPSVYTTFYEDLAALAGLVVAFLGVYLGHRLHQPYFDAAASMLIGIILCAVALTLVYESRGLLIGESASPRSSTASAASSRAIPRCAPHARLSRCIWDRPISCSTSMWSSNRASPRANRWPQWRGSRKRFAAAIRPSSASTSKHGG